MLKSWSIQNFKAILDSGELKLAPVTVLAGRNSSGKSSLIQSILMIAQTLSNRIPDRALLPNGPIVQLGTFEDILSEQTNLRTLVVGFTLETGKEESVKITSQFRSASSNGESVSAIEASKVNVESVELDVTPSRLYDDFRMAIRRLSSIELGEFLKDVSSDYLRLVPYANKELNYQGSFSLKDKYADPPEPLLVAFSHFLPTRFIGKYTVKEQQKRTLKKNINYALRYPDEDQPFFKEHPEILDFPFSNSLRENIVDLFKDESVLEAFPGLTLKELIYEYRPEKLNQEKSRVIKKLVELVVESILAKSSKSEKMTEGLEAVGNNTYVEYLGEAVEQTTQFFTSKIRYLGPLRADPQASQKFAPSSELDDVGAKGEYAAAVYHANQNAVIQWFNPYTEENEGNTLNIALNTWVRYLGVANEVKTQEAGLGGVSWLVVHMEGRKALPLPAVGVGISQILPILVMGLLAPSNTFLIVEQPELHLHSSAQARLGDFFMGLAKCSKQCLIETHSENIVSQLRIHIVKTGGKANADCLIYFVDQDKQGAARFAPIEISPEGNILNWPDGFFDETMLQEDRITAEFLKSEVENT